jgi:hypothetical protein
MRSFAQKLQMRSDDAIYHIEEKGEEEIEYFSYLIAVPPHKTRAFEVAFEGDGTMVMEDYGRIVYYGAGILTKDAIDEILKQD